MFQETDRPAVAAFWRDERAAASTEYSLLLTLVGMALALAAL